LIDGILTIPPTETVLHPPTNPLKYSVCAPGIYELNLEALPSEFCGLFIILLPDILFKYKLRA